MCGICGIINFNGALVQETHIRKMMQLMKHRGPDDEGVFIENNVGLGFVRLSIIDLSQAGHQPKFSQDERYVIVFNGEIFNYIELREELINKGIGFKTQTDTEVLLNAYIYWGQDCMNHFNGMWAFAIYDRVQKKTFAARDRHGIKPFYFLQTTNYFAFCSEIPPLLSLLKLKPKPDYQTIFDFLVFNRTDQSDNTFFEEIKKLQHGEKLSISIAGIKLDKWYVLRDHVATTMGFNSTNEFKELLSSSIELRLRSDVPVGVCLSGGLDSSSIVSILLNEYNIKDLNTFSAIYNEGQIGYETDFINEYKSLVKNMFFVNPNALNLIEDLYKFVKAQCEPVPTASPYAQFKVMELAQKHVVVTLDGQGADEGLAGYHDFFAYYFKDLLIHHRYLKLIKEVNHYLFKHRSFFGLKAFVFFLLPTKIKTHLRINEKNYLLDSFVNAYRKTSSISKKMYDSKSLNDALIDHFEYKLEHLLKWEDRNSMYFSLEARVPFLDYRFVEKALATNGDLLIKKGITKNLLRESMKNILPQKIYKRRDKIGFDTPQDEWFRSEEWQKLIVDLLESRSFRGRNIIDSVIALEQYQRHLSGKVNLSKEIWKWVHLELWFREYID
jgi:asparagine synthase (glutamine-hydrolysing)